MMMHDVPGSDLYPCRVAEHRCGAVLPLVVIQDPRKRGSRCEIVLIRPPGDQPAFPAGETS